MRHPKTKWFNEVSETQQSLSIVWEWIVFCNSLYHSRMKRNEQYSICKLKTFQILECTSF